MTPSDQADRSGRGIYRCGQAPRALPEPTDVVVLGATGSIGVQALEVAARRPGSLRIRGLTCRSRWRELEAAAAAIAARQPDERPWVVVTDPGARDEAARSGLLRGLLQPCGAEGLSALVAGAGPDALTVNGLVGAAGLEPTLAAAVAGQRIALANKESLVVGGDLVAAAAAAAGAEILPVDSEHSAIAQCLSGRRPDEIARLVLTASGGPFRGMPAAELAGVSLEQVLAHPTWEMGPKITVDSATLMNKGLEVIEAHHLFGLPYDLIDVVVHPGSIVHSLVEFRDGALLAQLGTPDMRVPLQYAMCGERHLAPAAERLDLLGASPLRFEPPDTGRFPCLDLARRAGREGGTAPIVLNAANEEAVAALLADRIRFVDIPRVIAGCLEDLPRRPVTDLESALAADREARRLAARKIAALST